MSDLSLDPRRTALVLIDLQAGILSRDTQPRPASEVLQAGIRLAEAFRVKSAPVVLVHVNFSADGGDRNQHPVDQAMVGGPPQPGWEVLAPELGPKPGDIVILKRNWGAFYGTELDLQLRRRGVDTLVLGGIATNMGVESTARSAYEHNYGLVFAEDATSGLDAEAHHFAFTKIFPRIGRVRSAEQVIAGLR